MKNYITYTALLTTFGVFGLHAATAPPWAFLADSTHDGPSSLLTKRTNMRALSNHAHQFPLLLSPPPSQSSTNRPLWVRASLTSDEKPILRRFFGILHSSLPSLLPSLSFT
jgi:hypothetical protein